ncbi:MAG: pectate lyase precursor [Candidatus Glassbacteria bacterium]
MAYRRFGRFEALLFLTISFLSFISLRAQTDSIPAFPGAEGFGAYSIGGRGGRVIHVTSLAPNGPGSLQEALATQGPRIIVFDTSGVIRGDLEIPYGQVTILGQTAPGAGITINGMLATVYDESGKARYDDIVIRFLRVRPFRRSQPVSWADALQFSGGYRCVLDHMTFSWASDETVDIYSSRYVTVQWCTVEESDMEGHEEGVHNYGMISGPEGGPLTVHHTLFAHHRRRCPAVANAPCDVRNNVVYDFRDGFLHDNDPNDGTFNIVGNYWKTGPSESQIFPFCFWAGAHYYLADNYFVDPQYTGLIQDPWAERDKLNGIKYYADRGGLKADVPGEVPPVTTHTPQEAYELVLERAGCFPRDTVSRRTINEVRTRTGLWGRHEPADLLAGLSPAAPPRDTDRDGMPDAFERGRGLDPADSTDHSKVMHSGYTAIEEYANQLAEALVEYRGILPPKGDLNGDRRQNIFDLLSLLGMLTKKQRSWEADINWDRKVDIFDLLALLRELKAG